MKRAIVCAACMTETLTRKISMLRKKPDSQKEKHNHERLLKCAVYFFRFFICGRPLSNSDIDRLIDLATTLLKLGAGRFNPLALPACCCLLCDAAAVLLFPGRTGLFDLISTTTKKAVIPRNGKRGRK